MNNKFVMAAIVSSALLTASFAALAQTDNPPLSDNPVPELMTVPNERPTDGLAAVDPACLKAALSKQNQTVLAALDAFYAAAKASYTARTTALLAAADLTGQDRMNALLAAEKSFQTSQKAAQEIWQKARVAAMDQFKNDQKACAGLASKGPKQPPQAALDACSGKVKGGSCTFTDLKGAAVTGACRPAGDTEQLVCAPIRPEGENGRGQGLKQQGEGLDQQGPQDGKDQQGEQRSQQGQRRGFGGMIMNFFKGLFGR